MNTATTQNIDNTKVKMDFEDFDCSIEFSKDNVFNTKTRAKFVTMLEEKLKTHLVWELKQIVNVKVDPKVDNKIILTVPRLRADDEEIAWLCMKNGAGENCGAMILTGFFEVAS